MGRGGAEERLLRLRRVRNRQEADMSLRAVLEREGRRLKKAQRAAGGAGEAWASVVPATLADRARVVHFSRGVLTVRVVDDSTRFALDRWLRAGGMALLAGRAPATLSRVRLVL